MNIEEIEIGTVIKDIETGQVWTIDRLPSKKLRSFGTSRSNGSKVFIYRNELARFTKVS